MNTKKKRMQAVTAAVALLLTVNSAAPLTMEAAEEKKAPLFTSEAENCTITTGATVTNKVYNDEFPEFSGDGFVWAAGSGGVEFEVEVKESAMYEISSRCWTYIGDIGSTRMQKIAIDGVVTDESYYIPNNGNWYDYSFGYVFLPAGKHTVEIGAAGGWGYILYDTVTLDYADMPDLKVEASTADKKASDETKALMKYLTSQYGNHILSGQQEIYGGGNDGDTELEFEYIYDNTGKYPAIRAFDMMNYNPLYGWEDGSTGRVIQWVTQRGGIATTSWHLNVPIDFENYTVGDAVDWQKCTYKNYQTSGSTFNTENILTEGTKERAYWDAAVKMLAEQLLVMQDAKVPIILRPLHEAQGNYGRYGDGTSWFWWGDRGPEVFKKLWKLLFTQLTEEYGVHNCIWELNLYELDNSFEWYPGDEYVDMVAYDKYEGSPKKWDTQPATSVFMKLVNDTEDTKMVALSECDRIPAIDGMVNEGAWWLYFCPWYGEYLMAESNNTKADLKKTYNSEYVVTLDELPQDLYGFTRGNGGNWTVEGAYECEDGTLTQNDGTAVINYKYCSGTGYVFLKGEKDAIEQTVTVEKAGKYEISYGYQQNYEQTGKTQQLLVNGEDAGEVFFPFSIMFGESEPITVDLKAGKNTIKLVSVEGWTYFDYLTVKEAGAVPKTTTTTTATIPAGKTTTTTTATTVVTTSNVGKATLLGDVDCDKDVNINDVILLSRYVSEDKVTISETGLLNANVVADEAINAADITKIIQIIAKLDA